MRGKMTQWLAALAVTGTLLAPPVVSADDGPDHRTDRKGCLRPSYSRLTYWIPELRRVKYWFNPPPILEVYASDHYSEIPPSYRIDKFPCPYAEPAALYEHRPPNADARPAASQEAKP